MVFHTVQHQEIYPEDYQRGPRETRHSRGKLNDSLSQRKMMDGTVMKSAV